MRGASDSAAALAARRSNSRRRIPITYSRPCGAHGSSRHSPLGGRRPSPIIQPLAAEDNMLFRQLFDQTSGTYSYLMASRRGGEALIIDPVIEKVDRYLALVKELDLKLVKAVDT